MSKSRDDNTLQKRVKTYSVTVVDNSNVVLQLKTTENDGYEAVQLEFRLT